MKKNWKTLLLFFIFIFTHTSFSISSASPSKTPETAPNTENNTTQTIKKLTLLNYSPLKENYFLNSFPRGTYPLTPQYGIYDYKKLGVPPINLNSDLSSQEIKQAKKNLIDLKAKLDSLDENSEPLKEEISFLIGDLSYYLSTTQNFIETAKVLEYFDLLLKKYSKSKHAIHASYLAGLLLLDQKKYNEVINLGQRQQIKLENDLKWSALFRSLLIEAYYLRGRSARTEDFFWNIATQSNKNEITEHQGLRFSDSLFWQKSFAENTHWNTELPQFMSETTSSKNVLSKLYYAESLFQQGEYEESNKNYQNITAVMSKDFPEFVSFIDYRIALNDYLTSQNFETSYKRLEQILIYSKKNNIRNLIILQMARMALIHNHQESYPNLQEELKKMLEFKQEQQEEQQTIFLLGMILWELDKHEQAFAEFKKINNSKVFNPLLPSAFSDEMSQFIVQYLTIESKDYFEKNQYFDFLFLCDDFKWPIQQAQNNVDLLIQVGRAYIESGMSSSGARLFERLMFNNSTPSDRRDIILLELIRSYALLGQYDLMEKSLGLVKEVPKNPESKKLYYLNLAANSLIKNNFEVCVSSFTNLLQTGLKSDELYRYSVEGSKCARHAKLFDQSKQFLSFLSLPHVEARKAAQLNQKPETQHAKTETQKSETQASLQTESQSAEELSPLIRWQYIAAYERINLMVETENYSEAISLYQKLNDGPIQLMTFETSFNLLKAFQKNSQLDDASNFWKLYSSSFTEDWLKNFGEMYGKVIELMGVLQLLPNSLST